MFGQDKGKSAYNDKRYGDAKIYYQDILSKRKNDNAAKFGLGVTAYKQKDIETALSSLNAAKNSEDSKLASKAYYNLGNMLREQNKMDESLAFYKKAIELDPSDQDAKINFELLKQVMQEQQNQEQQNQEQQNQEQQNQEQQNQEQQNQEQQNQEQQNQEQQNQEQQNQEQQNQEQQDQEQQDQEQKDKKENDVQKTDQQIQAEAILNALKDQEKINQKRQIKRQGLVKWKKTGESCTHNSNWSLFKYCSVNTDIYRS